MKSEKLMVAIGFAVISILWGSTWLAIKIGLESVPPLFGVALRFGLAMCILFFIVRFRGERLPMHRNAKTVYLTLGFLTYSFPFALVYWAELYIPSGLASILFAVYPFVVALGSHFYLEKERLTAPKVGGILLGFSGVVMIFWRDIHIGDASGWAMIAILVSTLLQGISLIVVKKLSDNITPTSLTLGGMVVGVAILFILAFALEDPGAIRFDARGIGSILYLGTLGTVATFLTYYWLLKRIQAVYLSLVTFVTPVLAVILGAFVLGEELEPNVFSGAAAILAGILVANGREILSNLLNHNKQLQDTGSP